MNFLFPRQPSPCHIDDRFSGQVLDGKVSTFVCDVSGQNAHQAGSKSADGTKSHVKLHEIMMRLVVVILFFFLDSHFHNNHSMFYVLSGHIRDVAF